MIVDQCAQIGTLKSACTPNIEKRNLKRKWTIEMIFATGRQQTNAKE